MTRDADYGTLEARLNYLIASANHGRKLDAFAYCAQLDIETITAIESNQSLPISTRKRLISERDASLGAGLRLAAKHGRGQQVADVVLKPWASRTSDEKLLGAYRAVLKRERRPPLIGELLRQLGINKPRRSTQNQQEWERLNNRETVTRKALRKFKLSLSQGKRGRRW